MHDDPDREKITTLHAPLIKDFFKGLFEVMQLMYDIHTYSHLHTLTQIHTHTKPGWQAGQHAEKQSAK